MSAVTLLSRLEGVRRIGPDRWVGQCPAHHDRHPSLSVRELDDGRVLLHDFGGCAVQDVLRAVRMGLSDLYPERLTDDRLRPERRPYDALSVLRCIASEAEIASLAADNMANGMSLNDADRDRLRVAAIRLREAEELAHG